MMDELPELDMPQPLRTERLELRPFTREYGDSVAKCAPASLAPRAQSRSAAAGNPGAKRGSVRPRPQRRTP